MTRMSRLICLAVLLFPVPGLAESSMSRLTPVNPPHVNIPGVSQAMRVSKGDLLFVSGQVPVGPDGIAAGDLAAQANQVLANFSATLEASGADWSDVARVTIYVRDYDPKDLELLRTIRDKWIETDTPPASALVGVSALFHPDALIEIDGIAVLPDKEAAPSASE